MEEQGKIRISLGEWHYNVSMVGLINILENNYEEYEISKNYIEFSEKIFENFEEKYFDYLFDKFHDQSVYGNIVNEMDFIYSIQKNNYEVSEKNFEKLNNFIKYVKEKIKKNSYKAVYPYIEDVDTKILDKGKSLKTITLKRSEIISGKKEDIKTQIDILADILNKFRKEEYKKYILAKDIIYSYTNEFLGNVAMWDRNKSSYDPYKVYDEYFIKPVKDYLKADKSKYKMTCSCCEKPVKEYFSLTWINHTGVDGAKKSSHYWNYNNDAKVCPICNLLYSCLPAGMIYSNKRGFFINENQNIQRLIETNNPYEIEDTLNIERLEEASYLKLAGIIEHESKTKNSIREIQNIQIIKYNSEKENQKYTFNILSKKKLEIISENRKELSEILKANVKLKDQKSYVNLYQEVINRIYFEKNLYDLIYYLIYSNISVKYINNVLLIAYGLIGGKRNMENKKGFQALHKTMAEEGRKLRNDYKKMESESKIQTIMYKLLPAIRVKNTASFSEIIIKAYMYINKPVPTLFIDALKDDDKLQLYGYSFIMGLTGGENKKEGK